jgi:hypothetical protein
MASDITIANFGRRMKKAENMWGYTPGYVFYDGTIMVGRSRVSSAAAQRDRRNVGCAAWGLSDLSCISNAASSGDKISDKAAGCGLPTSGLAFDTLS